MTWFCAASYVLPLAVMLTHAARCNRVLCIGVHLFHCLPAVLCKAGLLHAAPLNSSGYGAGCKQEAVQEQLADQKAAAEAASQQQSKEQAEHAAAVQKLRNEHQAAVQKLQADKEAAEQQLNKALEAAAQQMRKECMEKEAAVRQLHELAMAAKKVAAACSSSH
jgi:hypothetical protein